MALFKKNPFWRNKQGVADCPGDRCPKKDCDESCPIWLNTLGLQMLQMGQFERAIIYYKRSLSLDPAIPETYNNMGMAYGMSDNHQEAYKAFKKAVELKPEYGKAMRGLIVSEKNLGMYDEALAHCDKFAKLPDNDAVKLRNDIISLRDGLTADEPALPNQTELLLSFLEKAREEGFIQSEALVHIPEVMVQAKNVCSKIIRDFVPRYQNDMLSGLSIILGWSAYAGIGAVYHWNMDWPSLEKNGIFETLTRARGIGEMDEYVMDSIGLPFGSPEEKEVSEFFRGLANECIFSTIAPAGNRIMDVLLQCSCAMYNTGMVFEMNRLGMK